MNSYVFDYQVDRIFQDANTMMTALEAGYARSGHLSYMTKHLNRKSVWFLVIYKWAHFVTVLSIESVDTQ